MEMVFCLVSIAVMSSLSVGGGVLVFSLSFILCAEFFKFSSFSDTPSFSGAMFFDHMSYLMVVMTFMVCIASIVSSCKDVYVGEKSGSSVSSKLGLETAVVSVTISASLVFCVSNIFLFFFFFEFSLIPTFWLILGWGFNPERLQAGTAMMLYTVCASMPLLVMFGHFYLQCNSAEYLVIKFCEHMGFCWFGGFEGFAWFLLMIGFLVKLPVFFVHTWLPKAHVEAPLAGSMLLAGVLLKLGLYGMMRMSDIFSLKSVLLVSEVLVVFSLWGGVLTSCYCMCQSDIKALIAYSSVGHMSVCLAGVLCLCSAGWSGALCLGFAHGLCSPLLFSLAGGLYQLSQSQSVMLSKGLVFLLPSFVFWWCVGCLVSASFPPSLNFIGEIACVCAALSMSNHLAVPLGLMCFLGGAYSLYLYTSICHGGPSKMGGALSFSGERYLYSSSFLMFFVVVGFLNVDVFLI